MTREEAKRMLPIIQAFAEGKTIELCCDSGATWVTDYDPSFKSGLCYRIKPESKYRPFKTQEECWNEMLKHQPFGWIMNENKEYLCLLSINKYFEEKDFSDVFKTYKFTDGTPFGKEE